MDEEFIRKLARQVTDLEHSMQFQNSHVKQLQTQLTKCLETEKRTASALARLEYEHSLHSIPNH